VASIVAVSERLGTGTIALSIEPGVQHPDRLSVQDGQHVTVGVAQSRQTSANNASALVRSSF